MEESVRSGGVVKKKTSSGCLIIKKKDEKVGGAGIRGISGSFQKDKKRARMMMNDSDSSDELLEPYRHRRPGENSHNGSVMFRNGGEDNDVFHRNGVIESERKRTKLGLFEFNGYNEFDRKNVRNENREERLRMMGSLREFESAPIRNVMVQKRKHSHFDSLDSSNMLSGRTKVVDCGAKNIYERDEDEVHFPISSMRLKYQEASDEPIRLQGKNGVLKVMVNKKKKMEMHSELQSVENRKSSMSEHIKKVPRVQPILYADSKRTDLRPLSIEREKSELKSQKAPREETTSSADSETDGTLMSYKLVPPSSETGSSVKWVKDEETKPSVAETLLATNKEGKVKRVKEEEIRPSAAETLSAINKEGKVKRGGSTEKQQLRERIRGMLIEAGWTIDYRPRKNRDYLDAVYISPSGTAYWSIIKAYDAFQKHLEEGSGKSKSSGIPAPFAPLSADLINKLTRQTKKKIEKEMKKKIKEENASRDNKKTLMKESVEHTDNDQHDERLDSYMKKNAKKQLKGKFHATNQKNEDHTNHNTLESGRLKQDLAVGSTTASTKNVILGKKSQIIGRCTLLVRNSEKGHNSDDGYVPYSGKRTLLAWMIDTGTVKLSEKVQYMNRRKTRVKLEGWVTRDGIHCGCCSKILAVSKFELHAGSKLRQPFQNIVLESGVSLLQCLLDSWNRQKESERRDFYALGIDGDDLDDDACGACGDGGDLICCDGCPSTFHQSCLGIKMLPPGEWHCPNCTCKFCGVADENLAGDNKDSNELLFCNLCEKKYHKSCGQEEHTLPLNTNNSSNFCGHTCQEIYDYLQKILGVKHELESGFSWSLIQRSELDSDTLHRAFPQRVECNSKLALALSIMDECFLPIVDRRSEINMIHNVIYNCGSNFSRLNYRGFYTAILERGDEIISAASIRIHGTQLAEMPFIGTRHIYRCQGMCRRLLSSIEMVLSSLRVEKLIIPAVSDHMHTWTEVFGFKKLEESHKHETKSMNILVFPGTDMLQKQLVKQEASDGLKSVELRNPQPLLARAEKSFDPVHEVCKKTINATCSEPVDKADKPSSKNAGEEADENQNLLSDSDHRAISDPQDQVCSNSEDSSDAEICRKDIIHSSSVVPFIENGSKSAIMNQISPTSAPSATGKPDMNETNTCSMDFTSGKIADVEGVEDSTMFPHEASQDSNGVQTCVSNLNQHISPNVKGDSTMVSELKSETKGELVEGIFQSSETAPSALPGVSTQHCAEEKTEKERDVCPACAKGSKMCFKHGLNLQS